MRKAWIFLFLGLASVGSVGCSSSSKADTAMQDAIVGTWSCEIIRTANLSSRPWYIVFHEDGTATYSSGTNTTNLPAAGFTSRSGNGDGDWGVTGTRDYNWKGIEFLYRGGNIGGRWLLDISFHLRTDTERTAASGHHRLCSGSAAGDDCTATNHVRATRFVFDPANGCECLNSAEGCSATSACLNNAITGETDVFSTPSNGVITAVIRCNPLEEMTTYGSTSLVFPIPAATP